MPASNEPGGETAPVPLLVGHGDGLVQSNAQDKDCRVYFILLWPYLCNFWTSGKTALHGASMPETSITKHSF